MIIRGKKKQKDKFFKSSGTLKEKNREKEKKSNLMPLTSSTLIVFPTQANMNCIDQEKGTSQKDDERKVLEAGMI